MKRCFNRIAIFSIHGTYHFTIGQNGNAAIGKYTVYIKNKSGDAIAGVLMIDMRTGDFVFVQAQAVLLATGGGPTMYKYHTPSGDKSCDGLAMALRAGLPLRDMEMVQFHPTGLLAGTGTRMTGTVLEEGLRGAGGHLLNGAKERFMPRYDERADLALAFAVDTVEALRSCPLIADVLVRHGVERLFTLVGGHVSPILTGAKARGIRVVDLRDEGAAVFAADATARLTGRPGVAVVTAGPGLIGGVLSGVMLAKGLAAASGVAR